MTRVFGWDLGGAVDEWVGAIALEEDGVAPVFGDGEAKVEQELACLVEVGMCVVHVCDAHEFDFGRLLSSGHGC